MLIIAGIFSAMSAFAATPTIQEALNPPEMSGLFSVIAAPAEATELELRAQPTVVPFNYRSNHLSTYIIISDKKGLYADYTTAGFWNEILEVETPLKFPLAKSTANRDQMQLDNFREVETLLKFPCLIQKNSNVETNLELVLVA